MVWVSKGEFRMLSERVTDNSRRMDQIDTEGTRDSGVLATQVATVIKDVSELRQALRDHGISHEQEERNRVIRRRWLIGTIIAVLAVVETPLLYLVTIIH